MVKKSFFLSLVLFFSLAAVVSCAVDIDKKGREALDYFLEAVADGKVEDVEILTQGGPCMTLEDLSDEEQTGLLTLIENTQFKRALKKDVESPGTPDGLIKITLNYGQESIGCYGGVVSWIFSAQYGWYILVDNESLSQWIQEYIAK